MKRLYFVISLLFAVSSLFSQENGQNYVVTRTMLNESGTQYIDNIQYFDGLGRPFMNVQKGVTPGRSNLVALQEYDGFGRASKSWLPHVSTSAYLDPGSFKRAVPGTYNDDSRPYIETVYENSPLSRVLEQRGPGADWEGHPVSASYLTNTASGELSCKYYYVNASGGLSQTGMYAACELYVVKSTDEDGSVSYLFTDKLDRQVLSRQMLNATPHDTYYVYDDFDNLRYVLPPGYQDTPSLALYAYQYKYDERGHCIEKTLPGCRPIKYVYDKADNLVFSQDGVQRGKGEWTFCLYDVFHRLVMRGICTNGDTSSAKDRIVSTRLSRNSSTRMILPEGIGGTGYSSSFGIDSPTLHIVNYYDDYTFLGIGNFSGKPAGSVNAKGLLTGNITFALNSYDNYCTVTHYDMYGRVAKVIGDNDMQGTETTATTYTFTGKPLVVKHVHEGRDMDTPLKHTETYRYTYDHAERLTRVTHQLDAHPAVVLSANTYDGLGRLQSKTFHGNPGMKTTYRYNIRDWLTGISGESFTQSLYYNLGINGASPCYNGNICRTEWRSGNSPQQSYDFFYDGLDRLTSADYAGLPPTVIGGGSDFSEKVLEYDRQGNILRLRRYGNGDSSTLVDDLTFHYDGNRLMSVSDAGSDPLSAGAFNYTDLNRSGLPDFAYDANGNMTQNLDKEITSIAYNCLNLPEEITFSDNGDPRGVYYNYDADGVKRYVTHVTKPTFVINPAASLPLSGGILIPGSGKKYLNTTIYCGNVIYESTSTDNGMSMSYLGTSLDRILTEEGYVTLDGNTPVYHYFLKDHLGNVRVVMNQDGETLEQRNDYYPFGGIFKSTGDSEQPYKFGGKEHDPMHGLNWCDFGKRHLRNDGSGWLGVDPLCEKYYSISPYVYCNNNPVNCIDPDG